MKRFSLFRYVLIYSIVVTITTFGGRHLPSIRQMEFPVYDFLQKRRVVNKRTDFGYEKLQPHLENIFAINLDDAFFDSGCDRVNREQLGHLLSRLDSTGEVQTVFVNFLFEPYDNSEEVDEMLAKSMNQLGEKLILPYEIFFDSTSLFGPLTEGMIESKRDSLYFLPKHTGYLAPMIFLAKTEVYRYHQFRLRDGAHASIVSAILEANPDQDHYSYHKRIPESFEINYLLQDPPASQRRHSALLVRDASPLMNSSIQQLGQELRGKTVFIGLFDRRQDKYERAIDQFRTPVAKNLPGVYLILNSYLNVVSQTYLRESHWLFILILNMFMAYMGAMYHSPLAKEIVKPVLVLLIEALGFIGLFGGILVVFFFFGNIKILFVPTVLFFIRNNYLFQQYLLYENAILDHNPVDRISI